MSDSGVFAEWAVRTKTFLAGAGDLFDAEAFQWWQRDYEAVRYGLLPAGRYVVTVGTAPQFVPVDYVAKPKGQP